MRNPSLFLSGEGKFREVNERKRRIEKVGVNTFSNTFPNEGQDGDDASNDDKCNKNKTNKNKCGKFLTEEPVYEINKQNMKSLPQ